MVCVLCGQKTQVINSRPRRRTNQVWRRRECLSCHTVFSTLEATDYSAVWAVKDAGGHISPFLRDKLFLSLYRSCQHRRTATLDAGALTETVTKKLLTVATDGTITARSISQIVQVALNRFDTAASVHYQAFHKG